MPNIPGFAVERAGDHWAYTIDATHAPQYVMFALSGEPEVRTVELVAMDLNEIMDPVVGDRLPFCPVVADLSRVQPTNMGAPTLQWASGRALKRLGRVLLIFDPDTFSRAQYASFVKLSGAAIPQIEVVYSFEEALERLGIAPQ